MIRLEISMSTLYEILAKCKTKKPRHAEPKQREGATTHESLHLIDSNPDSGQSQLPKGVFCNP
jgi:hypothetical protein